MGWRGFAADSAAQFTQSDTTLGKTAKRVGNTLKLLRLGGLGAALAAVEKVPT